jgi:hypothetical protein
MDKAYVMHRLSSLPEEIALIEAERTRIEIEMLEREQELAWLQIAFNKKQNEFQAMRAIVNLLRDID